MSYHLDIRVNNICRDVELSKEEFHKAQNICMDQTNMAGFWKATVMPIRTNLDALLPDLLFPTLLNSVIKAEEAANRTFVSIAFALVWDAATFPIRLVALIPRIFYNTYNQTPRLHPLISFLKEKGLFMIQADPTNGRLKEENKSANQPIAPANKGKEGAPLPRNDEGRSLVFQEGDRIDLFLYETGLPDNELVVDTYGGPLYRIRLSVNREVPAFDVGPRGKGLGGRLAR